MPLPVDIEVDGDSSCSVMRVDGDINWETSSVVRAAILHVMNRCEERMVVDLKGVKHIDKVGASILVRSFDDAEKRRIDFLLTGLN
jgi:anti-anti-sigma factor